MSEWIRSLGGLDAPSRAVELGMADDEATADAVVDEAARDVANATTQAAMVDLLRDRSRNVAKILGIDKEVDGRDATPFQSIYCTKHELPLETYRFSPESYAFGIESIKMKDGQTNVYSIEKTKPTAKPESRKEAIISIRRLLEPVVFAGSGHGAKWSPADDIKSGTRFAGSSMCAAPSLSRVSRWTFSTSIRSQSRNSCVRHSPLDALMRGRYFPIRRWSGSFRMQATRRRSPTISGCWERRGC